MRFARLVGSRRTRSAAHRSTRLPRPRRLSEETLESRVLLAQTTGLFFNDASASDGYVLFSPNTTDDTYLIDKQGSVVNQWDFDNQPGLLGYLQPDGSLIRAAAPNGQDGNGVIDAAGAGGRIEWVDWDGTLLWSFDYGVADTLSDTRQVLQHHDFEVLPNGNILLIAWEYKTGAEAIAAGRNPANVGSEFYPDHIIEVQPDLVGGGATIVWEWHVWDHLVQDFDPGQDNYFGPTGVADNPGKIDINFRSNPLAGGSPVEDWTHANGIDYNAELGQIVLSVREFSEFWVIDHNTTTEQAAGPAGDLLYRWGNPQAYQRGDAGDRQLFFQHDAKWVPDGTPGAGNITVFDNGFFGPDNPDVSRVLEIATPVDVLGNYPALAAGVPHAPAVPAWTYAGAEEDFSAIISGTQRLENGNTLVTYGVKGTFSEVNPQGQEVWRYTSPYTAGGVLGAEDPIPNLGLPFPGLDALLANFTFRAIHYPVNYAPQFETTVTGRHLFYDNSKFDRVAGLTPAPGINDEDAAAVADDKSPYFPGGGVISAASLSSYSRGINGLMIDLAIPAGTLSLDDFEFATSGQGLAANNSPSTWVPAPAPIGFSVLPDTPSPGTQRVEFVWADHAIENRFLEVTVKGNDATGGFNTNTGLAASDVFYYGSSVGNTFENEEAGAAFVTDVDDELAIQPHIISLAALDSRWDMDRNGVHTAADRIVARRHTTTELNKINIGLPIAATADATDAVAGALASAGPRRSAVVAVSVPENPPAITRGSHPASRRHFWHQLGTALDPRASLWSDLTEDDALDSLWASLRPDGRDRFGRWRAVR